MATSCRSWWRNCVWQPDARVLQIDRMEDELGPLEPKISRIRELISSLELCHHKAECWVRNIIEGIAAGDTDKGLGTRLAGQCHPAEKVWQNACAALSAWSAGCPADQVDLMIGDMAASEMLARLGTRSALKEWQVHRVIEKIRSCLHWPQPADDPAAEYVWLLLGGGEYELDYRSRCPERYREHEEHWLATARTLVHDTHDGDQAALSLGLAVDMLWPCHWRFVDNLGIVLAAIGGNLRPEEPFAACGRNIALLPLRDRMATVSNTLRVFCGEGGSDEAVDGEILTLLGGPTAVKQWLAASLEKTLQLQSNPPAEMRQAAALAGPDWITR